MRFNMYSVKDEMTGKFMNPMFVEQDDNADRIATRNFQSNVNEIKLWKNNPNDFSLYHVGLFDDENGASSVVCRKIISGRSVLDVGTDIN